MASKPSSLGAPSHGSNSFSRTRPLHLLAEPSPYPSENQKQPQNAFSKQALYLNK